MEVTFEVCSSEEDMLMTYLLFVDNFNSRGLKIPPISKLRERYEKNELIIGKYKGKIISFYQFQIEEDGLCHFLVVYVSPEYRKERVATAMLDFGKPILRDRGVTHFEIWNLPSEDNIATCKSRNMILLRQEVYNDVLYNIWRKDW